MHRGLLLTSAFTMVLTIAGFGATLAGENRNSERDRWLREHREEQHANLARERQEREAMQQWDRAHSRPVAVQHSHRAPSKLQKPQSNSHGDKKRAHVTRRRRQATAAKRHVKKHPTQMARR